MLYIGSILYVFKSEIKSERDETALKELFQVIEHFSGQKITFFFGVVHSLSPVWLFETPWTAACQAPLFFTVSWNFLKLTSAESVMLANHLILSCPFLKARKSCKEILKHGAISLLFLVMMKSSFRSHFNVDGGKAEK